MSRRSRPRDTSDIPEPEEVFDEADIDEEELDDELPEEDAYDFMEDPESELRNTVEAIQKQYGAVVAAGNSVKQPLRISTGVFLLDLALMGGIPEGRVTHLVGEGSAGKSMLMAKIMACAQMEYPDQQVALIDVENTFDPVWAEKLGVNLDQLVIFTVETGEMAVDVADAVLSSRETSLMAIDSLAEMIPYKEAKASAEDQHMGLQARMFNELARKITNTTNHEKVRGHYPTCLLLNQYRTDIGKMFGDNRTIPGGRAIRHISSLMLDIKNKETIGKDSNDVEVVIENEHTFNITKWKVNNGPRTGSFQLMRTDDSSVGLEEGDVDNAATMVTYAKKFGFWSGAGKNQKLEFDDYSIKFNTQAEGKLAINEDVDLYYSLYNALLREQAIARRMPADFIARFV